MENLGKNTTPNPIRELVIKKHNIGHSIAQIANDLQLNYSTTQSIIQKFKNTGVRSI